MCVKNRNKNVIDMTRLDLDEIFCFDQDRIWYLGCERIICFNVPFSKWTWANDKLSHDMRMPLRQVERWGSSLDLILFILQPSPNFDYDKERAALNFQCPRRWPGGMSDENKLF